MIQSAGLRSDDPSAVQLADAQGPDAQRVSNSDHCVLGQHCQRVRALQFAHDVGDSTLPVV